MTTTKLTSDTKFFSVGDVLVYKTAYDTTPYRGAKVIDYAWVTVDGTETKFYALQNGSVKDNKFVLSPDSVTFAKGEGVTDYGFEYKWTPTPLPKFSAGDVLKGKGDVLFFYESEATVWKLDGSQYYGAQWSSLEARERDFGPLKVWTTAADNPFSKVIKNTLNKS